MKEEKVKGSKKGSKIKTNNFEQKAMSAVGTNVIIRLNRAKTYID